MPNSRIKSALEHRCFPAALAFFAFVIMLPALYEGLMMDDLIHRAILISPSQLPEQLLNTGMVPKNSGSLKAAMFNQFGFSRDSQDIEKAKDYGVLPWWTSDNIKASLWRPLSSFTYWLDYQLFPDSPALMHAHSILWFSAAIFLITLFYRRLMGITWVAGFAAVLYLLDENNYTPAMFIANRHAWVVIFFSMLCILFHDRWRKNNSLTAAVFAQVFLLASLLSGEAGITTFAFLFAYALMLEKSHWRRRILSLVPAIIVIVLWRITYNALGYGISGSSLYLDPVSNPLLYASALLKRVPLMLMGQLGCILPDLAFFLRDSARIKLLFIAAVFLVLLFIIFLPLLRKSHLARFWFTAMVLSTLPFCATVPSARNLYFVAIPAFGLVAQFVAGLFTKENWIPRSRFRRDFAWAVCIILILVHIPMAAAGRIITPRMTSFIMSIMNYSDRIKSTPGIEKKDVVIINAPSPLSMAFTPFTKSYQGEPLPKSIRCLVPSFRPLEVFRVDESTLLIKAQSGNLFTPEQSSPMHLVYFYKMFNDLFRSDELTFHVGDIVELSRLTIEIVSVDDKSMPTEVLFTFEVPLNDPSLHLLQFYWGYGTYLSFKIPPVGETVQIPGPPIAHLEDVTDFITASLTTR